MTGQYVEADRRTLLRTGIIQMASTSSAPRVWTVGDLGAFYTQHRAELYAHASRNEHFERFTGFRSWPAFRPPAIDPARHGGRQN
jgi:hypothetical protein